VNHEAELEAARASLQQRDLALAELRMELDDVRCERDRYIDRCAVLQDRLDRIRQVVVG
jgi:hypothetical protein